MPPPRRFYPQTRALTHTQTRRPGGGEVGIREEAPAAAPRAGKRMLPGTSPCEPALSSQLLLEMQPGSANSLLSGAAARAAVWSGPLSSLRQARSPHLHLPPRAVLSLTPLASPSLPQLLFLFFSSPFPTSSYPTFLSLDPSCSRLRMRRSAEGRGCGSSSPRNPYLLYNLSPPDEVLTFARLPEHSLCSWADLTQNIL